MSMTRTFSSLALARVAALAALVCACSDDSVAAEAADATETGDGDGDPGDGDGDDPSAGDGDGEPGDGDGDGNDSPCGLAWEAVEMKVNGQTHAAYDVAIADDGKFAVVGAIEDLDGIDDDAWIALYDASGELVWEQIVDSGNGPDAAVAVTFDQAGDLVLVGRQPGAAHQDLWLEKRSAAAGSVVWTQLEVSQFDGDNEPGDAALAPDGSIVVTGSIRVGDKDLDVWARKLDGQGAAVWTSSYSGSTDANGFSVDRGGPLAIAPDGHVYVGGSEGVDFETREAVILRFAPDGAQQWAIRPKADGTKHLHEIAALTAGRDGEAYAAIEKNGNVPTFWVSRFSPAGEPVWELAEDVFAYAPTDNWEVEGLALAADGTLSVGGRMTNEEVGQGISWSETWLANVDLDGVGQCLFAHTWQNTNIIPASTYAYGLAEGPGGAVLVGEIVNGPQNYLWVGGFR